MRYLASAGCLADRIFRGDCNSVYGSKVWHSTSKYRKTVWQCNALAERFDKAKTRLDEVTKITEQLKAKRLELERFVRIRKKRDSLLTDLDEACSATELTFLFKDGSGAMWTKG
ncbi:MAG: hypothetical protein PHO66_02935 [Eubacteriales bacterium]|nr:hypothetical protein [Eubacteriales bacterium]